VTRGTSSQFRTNCAPNAGITSDENGVMGVRGVWSTPGGMTTGKIRLEQITDGTANTIMVAEVAGRQSHFIRGQYKGTFSAAYPINLNAAWADYNIKVTVDGTDTAGTPRAGCCVVNCTNNDEIYGFHTGGAMTLRADGSVQFLRDSVAPGVLAALISREGGEVYTDN